MGAQKEIELARQLHGMGLIFETEESLRKLGRSRTPDILLLSPIGV